MNDKHDIPMGNYHEHDIQTDDKHVLTTEEWIKTKDVTKDKGEINDHFRDELLSEAHECDVSVFMGDGDTIVVETPSFTGSHGVYQIRDGSMHFHETGTYIHHDSEWEIDVECPVSHDRLMDVVRDHHEGEHPGEAALTVGERNPQLGGSRRI